MTKIDPNYKRYEANDLPASITRTIYVGYGIGKYNAKTIVVSDSELDSENFATVRLLKMDMTFELPASEVDIKGKMLTVLENEKQNILAENHSRLKEVQEKIDRLLAIEYQPEEAA